MYELWYLFLFLRHAKKQISSGKNEYVSIQSTYRPKKGPSPSDLWDTAVTENYLIADDGTHVRILRKGRELLEPKGVGFVIAELKYLNPIIVFLSGSLVFAFIRGIVHLIQVIIKRI